MLMSSFPLPILLRKDTKFLKTDTTSRILAESLSFPLRRAEWKTRVLLFRFQCQPCQCKLLSGFLVKLNK